MRAHFIVLEIAGHTHTLVSFRVKVNKDSRPTKCTTKNDHNVLDAFVSRDIYLSGCDGHAPKLLLRGLFWAQKVRAAKIGGSIMVLLDSKTAVLYLYVVKVELFLRFYLFWWQALIGV